MPFGTGSISEPCVFLGDATGQLQQLGQQVERCPRLVHATHRIYRLLGLHERFVTVGLLGRRLGFAVDVKL